MLRPSDGRVRHDGSSAAFIPGVGPVTALSFMNGDGRSHAVPPLARRRGLLRAEVATPAVGGV